MRLYHTILNKLAFQLFWRIRELQERLNILVGRQFIFVYTMGKVGSTSIYKGLKDVYGARVIFIHRMNKSDIDAYNEPFILNNIKPHRTALALFAKKRIIDKKRSVSIISAVREPISRNISDFFQDFKAYNSGMEFNEVSIEKSIQNFIYNYPHEIPHRWFQKDFSDILSINLSDVPFDLNKKYGHFDKDNLRILMLRTDLEDEIKERVLQDFIGKKLTMTIKNAHHQKAYHSYYLDFLNNIKLPTELVDEIYSKEYVQKFYTKQEISIFRTKWI